jgi:glycosyltransferase involved in cell wall biosynthesis
LSARTITIVASEILGRPGTGGAGTADSLLAVALAQQGHRVELLVASGREVGELSPEWGSIYASAGIEVRMQARLPGVTPAYLAPAAEVLRAVCDRQPEVVIVDDWRGLGYVALRARQLGRALGETAFVVHCHGPARVLAEFARKVPDTLGRYGEEIMERASVELADAVVSPSVWLLDWMRSHAWPVPVTAAVIQYVRESAALDRAPAQAAAGVAANRLAFFGPLREGKGIRIFLSALETLEPELIYGVELVFLGSETRRWTRERIEASLSTAVKERIAALRFEPRLERTAALAELLRPGTIAVMPSLLDNSPNTVAECIERGIPFVSTWTGGIPELVAEEDRARVLCRPTSDDLAGTLTRVLSSRPGFAPARPAREPGESLQAWLELLETIAPSRPRQGPAAARVALVATGERSACGARRLAEHTQTVEVEVVQAHSRQAGLSRTTCDWIVFLDDEDEPDDTMLDALVAAQATTDADVVTAAVRPADDSSGLRLFLGNPGALGLVENQYGVLGLIRRALLNGLATPEGEVDPDWPLFAQLALQGARIVSVPDGLSVHRGRIGKVGDVPGEGLAVLAAFEEAHAAVADLPRLAATLAASQMRNQTPQVIVARPERDLLERGLRVLRAEAVSGLARRARARLGNSRGG